MTGVSTNVVVRIEGKTQEKEKVEESGYIISWLGIRLLGCENIQGSGKTSSSGKKGGGNRRVGG